MGSKNGGKGRNEKYAREGGREREMGEGSQTPVGFTDGRSRVAVVGTLVLRAVSRASRGRRADHFCEEKGNDVGSKVDSHRKSIFYISSFAASSSSPSPRPPSLLFSALSQPVFFPQMAALNVIRYGGGKGGKVVPADLARS